MSGLFITGVGTGVGKTLLTTILSHQLLQMGLRVIALKPVVSGFVEGDPESDPALILRSLRIQPTTEAIAAITPWRFAAPISPHLAARREGRSVSRADVVSFCREKRGDFRSIRLIEGAGGVMSPMTSDATCLDLIADLGDPVVLVTGTYLGAISHTLTALEALRGRDAAVRAIVVSELADSVGLAETVEALGEFGAAGVPIHPLPRLAGNPASRWCSAPLLTSLCEPDHA
jgi:dethiobiotin synthetase